MPFDLSQAFDLLGGYQPTLPQGIDMPAPQTPPQTPAYRPPHGIMNVIGMIGDSLMAKHGMQPIYGPMMQQRQQAAQQAQLGPAIQNYLGDTDAGLASIFAANPELGTKLYGVKHPQASENPADVREYEYAKGNGYGGSFMDFLGAKGGPLIANNGDGTFTVIPRAMSQGSAGGGAAPPSAAVEYLKAHPELSSQFDQKYGTGASARVLGGATGNPSPTFPR